MKKIFSLWLFLIICTFGFTQIVTILDEETAQPLDLVTLESQEPRLSHRQIHKVRPMFPLFIGSDKIEIRY
ncbi:MAG: hypothetical protein R2750_08735 [Bacteroidales bacterium]